MRMVEDLEMKKHLIGIVSRFYEVEGKSHYGLLKRYFDYLVEVDFVPVLLTPENYNHVMPMLDAVLLPGGGDVNPHLYHEINHKTVFDEKMDSFEFSVISLAISLNTAILGICRGLQVINVYFKGTLHQDILNHHNELHQIKNSDLSIYRKKEFIVNSYHHQAINKLAPGFVPFLISQDGIVEGIVDKKRKILAVQYHPEMSKDLVLLKYFKQMLDK